MTVESFKELIEKGLSLDLVFVLEKIKEGREVLSGTKMLNLKSTLERKGYIHSGTITKEGIELLDSLKEKKVKTKKFIKFEDEFTKWWKMYPGTTEFTHKGRNFPGSRALRMKKEDCKVKFEKILEEGIRGEDMVKALEKEIAQKKDESLRTGQNKLNYMQNSLTYLNQRTFEPYIELIKETKEVKTGNSIDI